MKVLIACEESQTVCKAFREKGHEAYSCDIQDCSGGHPEWHILGDAIKVANWNPLLRLDLQSGGVLFWDKPWDLIIAHPPCTYLSNSGVCWLYKDESRWEKMRKGAEFFKALLESKCDKICVENPVMHKHAKEIIGVKQTQVVQPFMFGHKERKATCLWLKNLTPLLETENVYEEMMLLPRRERERLHYLPPGPDRAKLRSKTFQGIADAMADQWGCL